MPQDSEPQITPLQRKVLQACGFAFLLSVPVAFLTGLIAAALRAIVPSAWSTFCLSLAVALIVYAGIALFVLIGTGELASVFRKRSPDPVARTKTSDAGSGVPNWETVIAFVGRLFATLLSLGVLGVILYASGKSIPLPIWSSFGRLAGMGLLIALGFFASGTLVGFLFGLPRSSGLNASHVVSARENSGPAQAASPSVSETPSETSVAAVPQVPLENTNLEEISDWLTKIIVGVGLVELKEIPPALHRLSDFFTATCGNDFCGAIFLTMGVFFFITGFISSYVLARVYLKLAIALTGRLLLEPSVVKVATTTAKQIATNALAAIAQPMALSLIAEARGLINGKDVNEAQLDKSLQLVDEALQKADGVTDVRAVAFVLRGRALKRKALLKPQKSERDALLKQALEAVEQALAIQPDSAAAFYNRACYKALLGSSIEEIAPDVQRAFELRPALKKDAPQEGDFSPEIRQSERFRAVISAA